jgi:hypothetical protein
VGRKGERRKEVVKGGREAKGFCEPLEGRRGRRRTKERKQGREMEG